MTGQVGMARRERASHPVPLNQVWKTSSMADQNPSPRRWDARLAGVGLFPPALGLGVGRHPGHIGGEIAPAYSK